MIEKEREIIKDLQRQLAEKDKETVNIRHEICEKIRNYIDKEIYDRFQDYDVDYLTIDLEDFEDLLDEIERKVEE